MNTKALWSVILVVIAGSTQSAIAALRPDFSQQWVRTHPFTISGWANGVTGGSPSPALFAPSGLNTYLTAGAGTGGETIVAQHTSYGGYPWRVNLNAKSLTQAVMNSANHMYSTYPGGQGWFIADEPDCDEEDTADMLGMSDVADWLKSQFPDMLVYANLMGYSHDYIYKIDNYVHAVEPDVLMYDYYPFHQGEEMYVSEFFRRAVDFRAKALSYDLPCFAFIESFEEETKYRYISESELRTQMFSYLTMGYKGLSYFRYSGASGLLTGPSTKSPMYDIAAGVNPEILSLGNVLTSATSTAVRYVRGPGGRNTPSGLTNWSAGAGGDPHITAIQVLESGYEQNGLVGFFTDDNDEELFMLTNLNHDKDLTAAQTATTFRLTFDSSINDLLCWDRVADQQTVVDLDNHILEVVLSGGSGNLYKYNTGMDFIHYEPPNTPPVAVADGYSAYEDAQLGIPAAGVLTNDYDDDSDPLSAIKVSNPSHGSVLLNSNGSFTYTPHENYYGSDSFTYKANDGMDDSNVTTVSLDIDPTADIVLSLEDNGSPATGLHSYTLKATGPGITTLGQFTIDGEVHQVFHEGEASEWLGDGSALASDTTDTYVIFGNLRLPDLGGEEWPGPGDPPEKITEETIGEDGMGTLSNYDDSVTPMWDAYMKLGAPGGNATVALMQIVVADGDGFSVILSLTTSEYYDPATGESYVLKHDLSYALAALIAGDANGDGDVDGEDAEILAEHWQQQSGAAWSDGDFNRDGTVNDIDATLLAANWGRTTASTASAPEPGVLVLLLTAALVGCVLTRHNG